eukprot:10677743-Prorocentrum_lima.AAC.1
MDQEVHYSGVSQGGGSPGSNPRPDGWSPGRGDDEEWSSPVKIPSAKREESPHLNGCNKSCSCRGSWKSRW